MTQRRLATAVLLAALVVFAGCASAPIGGQTPTPAPGASNAGSTANSGGTSAPGAAGSAPDYTQLYDRTIGSVVMLRVDAGEQGVVGGSGFVYDRRGHVVTNEHVVGDADTVEVRFRDGEWRTADVVGTDVYSDLAVVRVADPPDYATPLPVAETNPDPGERVVAMGSPFGLAGSVTAGIVSGVNRSMPTENGFSIPDTVQTDAAINPGNSGGPLVSTDGTVVGVNRARGGENVGFAISAAIVERVVPALIARGSYEHTYVGIFTLDVTPAIADAYELDRARGLVVVQVADGSPAEGVLQAADGSETVGGQSIPTGGDVIVAVDGQPIDAHQDLSRYLALEASPGQAVSFTVVRNGTRQTVDLTLGSRPTP
ncbi:MAG TPA: trypsin-like peptidase domain-containing protein [Halobacteriales archaeon]|nr:trypsin-like peptidase domain-containing protein [Halobacteriales archaeon]